MAHLRRKAQNKPENNDECGSSGLGVGDVCAKGNLANLPALCIHQLGIVRRSIRSLQRRGAGRGRHTLEGRLWQAAAK